MTTQEFFDKTRIKKYGIRPRIFCKDGFNMSVQASEFHYSSPREDNVVYSLVEIGYPSKKESLIIPFAEEKNRSTKTVYGYVPIEICDQVIEKHGGIDELKTFQTTKP